MSVKFNGKQHKSDRYAALGSCTIQYHLLILV